ncbi:ubiquitin-like domain-containing protein [Luteimicrobium subarcticum]|uniref:Uncharacterized protein YabE (DUF348 family) n=1 Tax=Luteimicrobium subarcticum TaxID=620910 RepID=A0A2M8WSZ3_9MICO|nr:ubiquitin-like domain-containing protein [Luteimicrobium subarcticum]PJI94067.1 uncharacterized protein YabE (DUF348 family) [Luteimicrobium subarcticum]
MPDETPARPATPTRRERREAQLRSAAASDDADLARALAFAASLREEPAASPREAGPAATGPTPPAPPAPAPSAPPAPRPPVPAPASRPAAAPALAPAPAAPPVPAAPAAPPVTARISLPTSLVASSSAAGHTPDVDRSRPADAPALGSGTGTTRPAARTDAVAPRGRGIPDHKRRNLTRPVRWTVQGMVLVGVVATTGAFTVYHRDITLDVDGKVSTVDAYGWTVGDVLSQQQVPVASGDLVVPAVGTSARDVHEVVVRTSRQVSVEINGETRTIRTTASTVGELLDALGERDAVGVSAASRDEPLGRAPVRLVTSKDVHVIVDGQDIPITTTAATVQDVLTDAGVRLGAKDTTSAPLEAAAVDGLVLLVNRGASASRSTTEVVAFKSVETKDATLPKGQRIVKTAGRVGEIRRTYTVTTKGGVEVSRKLLKEELVTKPVDEVVLVGTMDLPDPSTTVVAPGSARAIGKALAAKRGWGDDQFQCLDLLWTRESGWRVTAANASSGAYGIPQSLPGSKMASVGPDWRTNAATQITWGLGYIANRYGTPCAAWGHSQATGWY